MEIKTEADDVDEGDATSDIRPASSTQSRWTSPRIRKKLKTAMSFNKSIQ